MPALSGFGLQAAPVAQPGQRVGVDLGRETSDTASAVRCEPRVLDEARKQGMGSQAHLAQIRQTIQEDEITEDMLELRL